MTRVSTTKNAAIVCLLAAMFFLGACVRTTDTALPPVDAALAADRWERFKTASSRAEALAGPFQGNATLYYSGKEDSQRVSTYFWGNGGQNAPYPLRLDIMMGPGSIIAQAREDTRGIFIYVPRDNLVYHGEGRGLLAFGVPVPFTLADLAALVTGRFGTLFSIPGDACPQASMGEKGGIAYHISGARLAGAVTLSSDGLPVTWREDAEKGWTLAIEYWPDSTRPTPRKLYISHPDGAEATFIIRELDRPSAVFTPEQLELAVPQNTRLAPLGEAQ